MNKAVRTYTNTHSHYGTEWPPFIMLIAWIHLQNSAQRKKTAINVFIFVLYFFIFFFLSHQTIIIIKQCAVKFSNHWKHFVGWLNFLLEYGFLYFVYGQFLQGKNEKLETFELRLKNNLNVFIHSQKNQNISIKSHRHLCKYLACVCRNWKGSSFVTFAQHSNVWMQIEN